MYFVQYAGKTFFNNSQQTTDATSQWLQDGSGQKIKVDKIKVKFESFLHLELYAKIVRYWQTCDHSQGIAPSVMSYYPSQTAIMQYIK